jgi:AcrR family transcriptional regulator
MQTKKTYKKWLEAAYKEFAENGPDFSLKALATKTTLPRATLYYHFANKSELISELLKYHQKIFLKYLSELKQIKVLIPDLYTLLYRYKTGVRFHQQLLRNCHIKIYSDLYYESNNISIKKLLPHIKRYFGFIYTDEEIFQFYNTLTDAWYARLDFSDISVEKMISLAEEIMNNVLNLSQKFNH